MSTRNILIVCWEFPPHHSIGGRRWAKFAKSLLGMGYNISVIQKAYPETSEKNWIGRNELMKMKLYDCKPHPIVKWLHNTKSFLYPLKFRFAKWFLSFIDKGTIYDKAIGIEEEFMALASRVIRKDHIDTLIVTGAPFNLVYYSSKLKKFFPDLRIVADYRDPWIHAHNYGMKHLSLKRKEHELWKQNIVFEQMDFITAPNIFLLDEIKRSYSGKHDQLARFVELPHAFDPDDTQVMNQNNKKDSKKVKIVYGGTLYMETEKYLRLLNDAILYNKKTNHSRDLELIFYTGDHSKKIFFSENEDCVKFSDMIGDQIFEQIAASDLILIILAEHNKNYTTSKFFDFLPYQKPYLYVGPEGFVSNKIESENLGYCIRQPQDLVDVLDKYYRNEGYCLSDIQKYTFDAVTKDFLNVLETVDP